MEYIVLLLIVAFTVWISTRLYYKAQEVEQLAKKVPPQPESRFPSSQDFKLEIIKDTVEANQELIKELQEDVKDLKEK